jgi:hypothetical protein
LEGFALNQSIVDCPSETGKKDIMRWEGGWAWWPEILIELEGAAMKKIERRMEDVGLWAREGSEGIGSGWVFFENSHRKDDLSWVVGRIKRGDDVTRRWGERLDRYCGIRRMNLWIQHTLGYRDSLRLRYDNLDNFDLLSKRSKEHVGSLTFVHVSFQKMWAEQMRITRKPVVVRW